jgi:voltage-gated potassium channel
MAGGSITALRRRLAVIFDDDAPHTHEGAAARRFFNAALAGLIIANIAAIILESVESIDARYGGAFLVLERFATAVFAIEYILRVWTAGMYITAPFATPSLAGCATCAAFSRSSI